jgi:hypothetical protein
LEDRAHSPDIATSNVYMFLHLKKHLVGLKFHEDEELKNQITARFRVHVT